MTRATGLKNAINTRAFYAIIHPLEATKLIKCFSLAFVARSYLVHKGLIILPAVDTSTFTGSEVSFLDQILATLENSNKKIILENL